MTRLGCISLISVLKFSVLIINVNFSIDFNTEEHRDDPTMFYITHFGTEIQYCDYPP